MPREIVFLDTYVPALLLMFLLGAMVMWALDPVIQWTGLYRYVWHPTLFRASLLVCLCGGLGLTVYR